MPCLEPITLKDRHPYEEIYHRYRDYSQRSIHVPCGRCIMCKNREQMEWSFRLQQEDKVSQNNRFITLTYDNLFLPLNDDGDYPDLSKRDVQLYLKRLRKLNTKMMLEYYPTEKVARAHLKTRPLRYFLVGEYGTEYGRPHYHALIFNTAPNLFDDPVATWQLGDVDVGTVQPESIAYTTKYMVKPLDQLKTQVKRMKEFRLTSKGHGLQYAKDNALYHISNKKFTVRNQAGMDIPMPRYIRDQIFSSKDDSTNRKFRYMLLDHFIKKQSEQIENFQKQVVKLSGSYPDPWMEIANRPYQEAKLKQNRIRYEFTKRKIG